MRHDDYVLDELLVQLAPPVAMGLLGTGMRTMHRRVAARYRPFRTGHCEPLAIVSPVFREDPGLFERVVESWRANGVDEIVCVIHESDTECIDVAHRLDVRVLVSQRPDKREAMRRGWETVSAGVVALVDSDTVWASDVARKVCEPFADQRIGGVVPSQRVLDPSSVWEFASDRHSGQRALAAFTVAGKAMNCLFGPTAVYRHALLMRFGDALVDERFLGVRCTVGDDTRLTELTLRAGYGTVLQRDAVVWSRCPATMGEYVRQRLRHSRSYWRTRLTNLARGWLWRHPYLAGSTVVELIERLGFWMCTGYLVALVVAGQPVVPIVVATWWLLWQTRAAMGYARRRGLPRRHALSLLGITWLTRLIIVAGLLTARRQGWLTRLS